jgi:hypothetical protein
MKSIQVLTDDQNIYGGVTSYTDKKLISTMPGDPGLIQITSMEQLKQMAVQAKERYAEFDRMIRPIMNNRRATFAKDLYLKEKYSWRAIAVRCWTEWNGAWMPPDNQLAGMKICEIAEQILKIKINPPPSSLKSLLESGIL